MFQYCLLSFGLVTLASTYSLPWFYQQSPWQPPRTNPNPYSGDLTEELAEYSNRHYVLLPPEAYPDPTLRQSSELQFNPTLFCQNLARSIQKLPFNNLLSIGPVASLPRTEDDVEPEGRQLGGVGTIFRPITKGFKRLCKALGINRYCKRLTGLVLRNADTPILAVLKQPGLDDEGKMDRGVAVIILPEYRQLGGPGNVAGTCEMLINAYMSSPMKPLLSLDNSQLPSLSFAPKLVQRPYEVIFASIKRQLDQLKEYEAEMRGHAFGVAPHPFPSAQAHDAEVGDHAHDVADIQSRHAVAPHPYPSAHAYDAEMRDHAHDVADIQSRHAVEPHSFAYDDDYYDEQ